MVRQAHRLGPLAVRVPRQQGVEVGLGLREQRLSQRAQAGDLPEGVLAQVQQRVGDDLVVAAARRVQPPARVAGDLGEAPLDGGVDVLVGLAEGERAGSELLRDLGEARVDRRGVGRGDDAAGAEHAGVGARGGHVLGPQAPVDRQRRVEPVECLGRAGAEAAAPEAHLLAHRRSTASSAPQTRSTWASVISGKKGSAIVDALIASVTGNSPGPWPWASW